MSQIDTPVPVKFRLLAAEIRREADEGRLGLYDGGDDVGYESGPNAMPYRQHLESPGLAAVGMAAAAGSAAYKTLSDAGGTFVAGIDPATLVNIAGVGLAVVFGGLIPKSLDAYTNWRKVRRQAEDDDRQLVLDRMDALRETIVELRADVKGKDERIADLLEQLGAKADHLNANVKHTAGINAAIGQHNAETLDKVASAMQKTAAAVQQLGGSSSGIGLDDTVPTPPPKPER